MHGNAPQTEILDLQWLIGELESLKPLVEVVPFDEKPGDLPSITELLQEWYEECLLRHTPALGMGVRPFHRPSDLAGILDASIRLRADWLVHLETMTSDSPAVQSLRGIIRKERGLFRQIAERIMTIQKPVP